jgi:selenocysteine-specific elongation factor
VVPAVLWLARPIAAAVGDRLVLRWPSPAATAASGRILDLWPPRGPSRRRVTPDRLARLVAADGPDEAMAALVDVHGVLRTGDADAVAAALAGAQPARATEQPAPPTGRSIPATHPALVVPVGEWLVAGDLVDALAGEALEAVDAHRADHPLAGGMPLALLRAALGRSVRRRVSLDRGGAARLADAIASRLVTERLLVQDGELVRRHGATGSLPSEVLAAMDRLEASLTGMTPPSLDEAARAAGCPPEGIRALERDRRIVRLDGDVAYAAATYRELETLALDLADRGPLSPAAFRDATGTSRKYALAVLEDLDRRAVLRRTPEGHVRGPRAPRESPAATAAGRLVADP